MLTQFGKQWLIAQSVKGSFDAILMDMQMPMMDGLAVTRAIRSLDRADAKSVPILALGRILVEKGRL